MLASLAALIVMQTPTLTPAEVQAGWRLLFDGKTTAGWHNFKSDKIGPGWVVKDGVLTSEKPEEAGDIISADTYQWFELSIDFRLTPRGNSGVMFHVQNEGDATWHSGPEVQIYDHGTDAHPQKTGWLYELYSAEVDATKPAGQWNTLRLKVTKEKCETWMNGTKYYDFVLGSDDFKARLAKSKFADMPNFAKKAEGHIAIQGDHGVVSFRNIKIRRL